ncbi:MFS transporter [Dactylosporangium vinaceum]|uniref:MFS transporter n=1 Tax=Dactylosporangium vinaceum TaxID=53362 RepID=A0ABV5MRT8_9ACTN|nr:MFS transporter [Dactylosporangium vinaceum]UAC00346.1 MFS transporter [Dactylosporangium vinaceum]
MRKWLPLLAVSLSTLMLLIDITIVSIAAPALARDLHASFAALQWTVDLYVLVLAALLMAAGSLADRIGHRRVFVAGLVVFAAASLACGLAPGTGSLIAARGVQGLGAAAMYATNAALLGLTYSGRDRSVAFGIWGAANGAAAAAGPILGGLLTEHIGWRAIFLVNLPVAAAALLLARHVTGHTRPRGAGRPDRPGVVSFTAAASLLVYGLIRAGDAGWSDRLTVAALVLGGLAALGFVAVELRRREPMLDLRLFRSSAFSVLMLAAAALTASAFAGLVFVSVWAQTVLRLDAMDAGLVLAPMAVVAFVVAGAGGRLLHGVPARLSIGGGLLLIGAGDALGLLIGPGSGWPAVVPALVVVGVGVGLSTPVIASATLAVVPPARAGMANGASNTFRQLGYALALPVFATVLAGASGDVLGGGASPAAFADGLDRIFAVSAAIAFVGGFAVLTLLRTTTVVRESDDRGLTTADPRTATIDA